MVSIKETIQSNIEMISKEVLDEIYLTIPDLKTRYTLIQHNKSIEDIKYHLNYLIEAIDVDSKKIFIDYINWVKVLFEGIGISQNSLVITFEKIKIVLERYFQKDEIEQINLFINEALTSLSNDTIENNTFLLKENPLIDLAKDYLDSVLKMDRHKSSKMILNAVTMGVDIHDIYIHVFEPVQHEVGRL
ncbi:MAG: hypothetical protein JW702_01540 [Clostridiales bacterium]|nr:hypothetical protein [Clostridiales bacterium]